MATFDELDRLSSGELHERAVRRAKRHLDVRFFWALLEIAPVAEVAESDVAQAAEDVEHWSAQVHDAFKREPVGAVDGRRGFYIDYLLRHGG